MTAIDKVQYLQIGVQGENIAMNLEFDMTAWAEQYPDAAFHILFKPYNETEVSPQASSYDSETKVLTWTVGAGATAIVGVGYTEIRAQDGEGLIKKTRVIPTAVENSVSGVEVNPPAAYADWVAQVLNAGAAVIAAAHGTEVSFSIGTNGHLIFSYTDEDSETITVDLGPVDAYGMAVEAGYQRTRTQFEDELANTKNYCDEAEAARDAAQLAQAAAELAKTYAQLFTGAPRTAATAAAMEDTDKIYVYTGSTGGGLTNGKWYYHNGTAWTEGGTYNSTALTTDTTLAVSGAAADAKVTGDKLNEQKSALKIITGNESIPVEEGGYIATNGSTADISTVVNNANYKHCVVDCSATDVFTIKGTGGATPRLWAFLGAESNGSRPVLDKAAESAIANDIYITAPSGTQKLVVNVQKAYEYYLIRGKELENRVTKTENDISNLANDTTARFAEVKQEVRTFTGNAVTELTESGYLNTSGTTVSDITAITPSENYKHIIVDCHYGDKFRISGTGGSSPRLWAFLGNKTVSNVYYVLEKAEANESATDKIITAPVNTEKLVINVNVNSSYMFVQGDYIKSKLKTVEDDLYEYEQITVSERTDGKWLSKNNNINNDAGSCYTGYVPVIPGRKVKLDHINVFGNRAVCGYDIAKNFSSDYVIITNDATDEYVFTVPSNVYFIRITGFANTTPTVSQSRVSLQDVRNSYDKINIIIPNDFRKNIIQKKIVTLIDDDGDNETQMTNLKNTCLQLGMRCTFAVVTKLMENDASHMQFIKGLQNEGFHIANHTNDHSRWYGSSEQGEMFTLAECEADLLKAFKIFEENGFYDASKYFVYTGSSSSREGIPELIKKWCECAATISWGVNKPETSGRFQLNRTLITPENNRDLNYYKNLLDSYENEYGDFWIIFYGHCKYATSGGFDLTLTGDVLDYAMSKGYVPMTYNEAWNYRKGQYMMQEAFAR